MKKHREVQDSCLEKHCVPVSALALLFWLGSFVQWRLKLPITANTTHFYWHNSDIYCLLLYTSVPLSSCIQVLKYLNFIRNKHAKSNYWLKELGNATCSNAIGQLCKIKPNLFCHSLIYRPVWAGAQTEVSPVSADVVLMSHHPCCISPGDSQGLAAPAEDSPRKSALALQLHNICPVPSWLHRGSAGAAGTGGEWGGQAVNKALHGSHWASAAWHSHRQGCSCSGQQSWALPRQPSRLSGLHCASKAPRIFRPARALEREFQSIRLGELGELL